jgi:hypothetical protein
MANQSDPDTLKAEIIQMLGFPRSLMRSRIELDQCEHAGNFSEQDPLCQDCPEGLECEWLYHSDEYSGLQQKPLATVVSALSFAVEYVDARVTRTGHNRLCCHCDTCSWLRRATDFHHKVTTATRESAA